jgi:hypothetical protein
MHIGKAPYKQTKQTKQTPWPSVRERTIPTERPPLEGSIHWTLLTYDNFSLHTGADKAYGWLTLSLDLAGASSNPSQDTSYHD